MELQAGDFLTDNGVTGKQADYIDLSNTCRAFYNSRLESTQRLKDKWKRETIVTLKEDGPCCSRGGWYSKQGDNTENDGVLKKGRHASTASLSVAINTLRTEIVTLMDQDLCLMKQLLTLNEEIEDLKWRRVHVWNMTSSIYGSDMILSAASLGRVDVHPTLQYPTPSSLSLQLEGPVARLSIYNDDDPYATFNRTHFKPKAGKSLIDNNCSSMSQTEENTDKRFNNRTDTEIVVKDSNYENF